MDTNEAWFHRFSQLWSKEKCRNVIMSKSNKVENKNGTSVEILDAFKRQHMIVRNFNALTLSRTFSPSLLFLFSTFSFFGIFMFRHFYFRPKLGLPFHQSFAEKTSNYLLLLIKGFLSESFTESCSKGVHSIELDEFYSDPSFVFVGLLRGRILPGFTKIHRILCSYFMVS